MNGDTLDDSGAITANCARCGNTVTPRQWYLCPLAGDCCMNCPPGPESRKVNVDVTVAPSNPEKLWGEFTPAPSLEPYGGPGLTGNEILDLHGLSQVKVMNLNPPAP